MTDEALAAKKILQAVLVQVAQAARRGEGACEGEWKRNDAVVDWLRSLRYCVMVGKEDEQGLSAYKIIWREKDNDTIESMADIEKDFIVDDTNAGVKSASKKREQKDERS